MQLIALLRNDPFIPPHGRVTTHRMDDGPRLSENYHEAIRNANRQKVIDALHAGYRCVKTIAAEAGMDYTTAKSHLDKLIAQGNVKFSKEKNGRTQRVIYWWQE